MPALSTGLEIEDVPSMPCQVHRHCAKAILHRVNPSRPWPWAHCAIVCFDGISGCEPPPRFTAGQETTECSDPLQAASTTWQRQEAVSPSAMQAMQALRGTHPDLVQVQSVLNQVAETGSLEAGLSLRHVYSCGVGSHISGGALLAADA